MSYDARTRCAVCAWRGACAKKYSMESSSRLHCPDFSRDASLVQDEEPVLVSRVENHKKVEDVFGDGDV